jgi:hypothetical protein
MIFFEAFMIWYLLTTSFVHVHSRGSNIFGSKIIKFLALVWIEPDQLHFFWLRSTSSVPKYEMFCQAKVVYQTVLHFRTKEVLYKSMINKKNYINLRSNFQKWLGRHVLGSGAHNPSLCGVGCGSSILGVDLVFL